MSNLLADGGLSRPKRKYTACLKYLSPRRAGGIAGVGEWVIRNACKSGRIPHERHDSGFRISHDAFSEFLKWLNDPDLLDEEGLAKRAGVSRRSIGRWRSECGLVFEDTGCVGKRIRWQDFISWVIRTFPTCNIR